MLGSSQPARFRNWHPELEGRFRCRFQESGSPSSTLYHHVAGRGVTPLIGRRNLFHNQPGPRSGKYSSLKPRWK